MKDALPQDMTIRNCTPEDHPRIVGVMKDWWGGRDLRGMLPRLFLEHFTNTSFVVENDRALIGFLIGFLSPARPREGYIHFVGVHPAFAPWEWARSCIISFSTCADKTAGMWSGRARPR